MKNRTMLYSITESLVRDINMRPGETVSQVAARIEAVRGGLCNYKLRVIGEDGVEIIGDYLPDHVLREGDSIHFTKEDVAFPALNAAKSTIQQSCPQKSIRLNKLIIVLG